MIFLILIGWFAVIGVTYAVLPLCPIPKGMIMTKVMRWQATLFCGGWIGKFFAGAAFFAIGSWAAITICVLSLAMLLSVVVVGLIFRNPPTRSELAAKLRKQLSELEG